MSELTEWTNLMVEAKEAGVTVEQVRKFLKEAGEQMKKADIMELIEFCFNEQLEGYDYVATEEDKESVYDAYKRTALGNESIGYYVRVYIEMVVDK
jgi:Anti-repressor SinI